MRASVCLYVIYTCRRASVCLYVISVCACVCQSCPHVRLVYLCASVCVCVCQSCPHTCPVLRPFAWMPVLARMCVSVCARVRERVCTRVCDPCMLAGADFTAERGCTRTHAQARSGGLGDRAQGVRKRGVRVSVRGCE